MCITRGKNNRFRLKNGFSRALYKYILKICELHRAIFSSFYNNSQPNFAILLILRRSFQLYGNGFRRSCPNQNFVYSWNHPFSSATNPFNNFSLEYPHVSLFRLEKPVFRIKLGALKLSHLLEHDIPSMRRSTNKLQQDYHDQNVRPSGWYVLLQRGRLLRDDKN
jgi:hypothetical protein